MALRRCAWNGLAVGSLLLAAACGGSSPGESTCVPGESSACTCTDGASGAQVCGADGTFGACTCTAVDAGGDAGGGCADGVGFAGTISLVDGTSPAGVVASVDGSTAQATVAADGSYRFDCAPPGLHTLRFTSGPYEEVVPDVSLVDGLAILFEPDGTAYPLPALVVPRAHRLFHDDAHPAQIAVAPRHVAWMSSIGALYLAGVSGEAALLVGSQPVTWFGFDPAGTWLYWIAQDGTFAGAPTSGGAPVTFVTGVSGPLPAFSTDGSTVIVETTDASAVGTIHAIRVGATTAVALGPIGSHYHLTADGLDLVYETPTGDLFVAHTDGTGTPTRIAQLVDYRTPTYSTDGRHIAYVAGTTLQVTALGGTTTILATGAATAKLSPDGNAIWYQLTNGNSYLGLVTGANYYIGANVPLWSFTPDSSRALELLPTGHAILAPVGATGGQDLGVVTAAALQTQPVVSDDGNWLVYFADFILPERVGPIRALRIGGTAAPVELGELLPIGGTTAPALTRGADTIVTTDALYHLGTSTDPAETIPLANLPPILSPDGHTIAFFAEDIAAMVTRLYVLDTATGAYGASPVADFRAPAAFSPDGSHLAYQVEGGVASTPSAATSETPLLESSTLIGPTWLDSGHVAAETNDDRVAPFTFADGIYVATPP